MTVKPLAMRDAFLERIWQEMALDPEIFFVTADFGSPVLDKIRVDFPDRFANVGIAEQNLINVTAGLALEGFKVFAYAIAPFITMRCFEQNRVNLALLSKVRPMNVNLIGVGAGYSYVVSGPTHQCYEDITLMRSLPGFEVLSPADHIVAEALFDRCMAKKGLRYLRFDAQVLPPVYNQNIPDIKQGFHQFEVGERLAFISTGFMTQTAFNVVAQLKDIGFNVGLIDIFDLTSFDEKKLRSVLSKYDHLISLEEGFKARGGLDSMLFDFISRNQISIQLHNIGIDAGYQFELGSRAELHELAGISPNAIFDFVQTCLN